MFFETLVTAASIELAESQSADDFKQTYRELLAMDGVAFPTPEVEQTVRLYDAQAAADRGAPALAEDGSQIDVSGFDREAARRVLQANKKPLDNAEKLDTLARLGFLARAGSLFVMRTITHDGREEAVTMAQNITNGYKHFVQASMATAAWEQPWQDVVANSFEGSSMTFPLDSKGVLRALKVLHHELFMNTAALHFSDIVFLRHNLFVLLEGREECATATQKQIKAVAQLGIFYGHSPEGCETMIRQLVADERLPGDIDWLQALRHAWAAMPR